MPIQDLRKNKTMAHILDALDNGQDIGHYGRLTFAMVAQYFADEEEIVTQLQKDKDFTEEEARIALSTGKEQRIQPTKS